MNLILIASNPALAKLAVESGVDRIMIDLEVHGKHERQGHLNSWISTHKVDDISIVRSAIPCSTVIVRINPIHDGSSQEIENVILLGADIIMLPMFTTSSEVSRFINYVDKRAKCCLLLETAPALVRIHEILDIPGIDEVHIGLNDLHLDLRLDFMFEILSGGVIDYLANILSSKGIYFGFGGVGPIDKGILKSNLILSEHIRLNSNQVILSRDFVKNLDMSDSSSRFDFVQEVYKTRQYINSLSSSSDVELRKKSLELRAVVANLIK